MCNVFVHTETWPLFECNFGYDIIMFKYTMKKKSNKEITVNCKDIALYNHTNISINSES